jgi:hypothetical protein
MFQESPNKPVGAVLGFRRKKSRRESTMCRDVACHGFKVHLRVSLEAVKYQPRDRVEAQKDDRFRS